MFNAYLIVYRIKIHAIKNPINKYDVRYNVPAKSFEEFLEDGFL